jgi:O-methyltransferase
VRDLPPEAFELGRAWPRPFDGGVMTMIGQRRLENVQACVSSVLRDGIAGDLIECGVWRGGAAMLMQAVLAVHGFRDRGIVLADSFDGVPAPNAERFPQDAGFTLHQDRDLAVSSGEVIRNFRRYGLLRPNVTVLEGWFRDTLPTLRGKSWSLIRLDGDLYESTHDGLTNLYEGLAPGGYLIIDDYGVYPACAAAVHDFRAKHGITEAIIDIDGDCTRSPVR